VKVLCCYGLLPSYMLFNIIYIMRIYGCVGGQFVAAVVVVVMCTANENVCKFSYRPSFSCRQRICAKAPYYVGLRAAQHLWTRLIDPLTVHYLLCVGSRKFKVMLRPSICRQTNNLCRFVCYRSRLFSWSLRLLPVGLLLE